MASGPEPAPVGHTRSDEAAGAGPGHTSAAQAGELARSAGAQRLALIHYPVAPAEPARLVAEAQAAFGGPVTLTEDYMRLDW